jgi:hypothetical protein
MPLTDWLIGTMHETGPPQRYTIFSYSLQNERKPPKAKHRKELPNVKKQRKRLKLRFQFVLLNVLIKYKQSVTCN